MRHILCTGLNCCRPKDIGATAWCQGPNCPLKALGAHLNIALIHHPLEWLSPVESSNITVELENSSVDVLLRGHLHDTRIESLASPEGELLRIAAGAAYQARPLAHVRLLLHF